MLKKHIKKQRQQPLQFLSNLRERGKSLYYRSHKPYEKKPVSPDREFIQ